MCRWEKTAELSGYVIELLGQLTFIELLREQTMSIRQLEIRNFRGIEEFSWSPNGDLVCLIGPNNSTKSTVLSAIELALSPRWRIPFEDSDFHEGRISDPIRIRATVGNVPDALLTDQKYGLHIRGWKDGELFDEPRDDDAVVLTVQLEVDKTLEPEWSVVTDRSEDVRISARDREKLGCMRLGGYIERDLTWKRGSALTRITDSRDEIEESFVEVTRRAKSDTNIEEIDVLSEAASDVQEAAEELGVRAEHDSFAPRLDFQDIRPGKGAMSLHDGPVPLRKTGLGTRRLVSLAAQSQAESRIVLVDELESALEPFRIRKLVRTLRERSSRQQTIVTTHSPICIEEMKASELTLMRSNESTTAQRIPEELQGFVRANSEALVSRKIVVCEGKTERGICRGLDQAFTERDGRLPLACFGTVPVNGGGSEASEVAREFCELDYDVAFFADSDRDFSPSTTELEELGVTVFQWENDCCTETRVCEDLPWDALSQLIRTRLRHVGDEERYTVRDRLANKLSKPPASLELENALENWDEIEANERESWRGAIADVSNRHSWFKNVELGEVLGRLIVDSFKDLRTENLGTLLEDLWNWCKPTNE